MRMRGHGIGSGRKPSARSRRRCTRPSTSTAPAPTTELDEYLRAYYGQPLDVMRHVQAIRGGSVQECLDWLARYVDAGARHLILRIGSLDARAPNPWPNNYCRH